MAQRKKNPAWADCCEDWGGYMAAKKAKLEEQFQEAAKSEFSDSTTLFNGIAIFVNGYTSPSADELKRLMMAHGGIYHHYLRSQSTTHMIASNLPYSKIVAYRKAQNPLPLCKPEWITDSIKEGKLLNYRNYLLYSQCTKNQPAIFAQMTKQTKSDDKAQNVCSSTNSTITSNTLASNNKAVLPDKESLKLQATSNPEVASVISNCTKNPEFLTEFYNNSRLHHIATMGAMFKDYINDLRDKSDRKFPGLEALKQKSYEKNCKAGPSSRIDESDSDDDLFNLQHYALTTDSVAPSSTINSQIIMHIDMDCFFVSVGLRNHPELRGFPIAVAHAKGNKPNTSNDPNEYGSMSEVASCSYEARKAGVKNGMLLGQALKLCPNLKTIQYDFDGYKEVSYTLYDTVASYTLDIEAVSCDEMYADCSKILQTSGLTPLEFANVIRKEIKEKTSCPVSTGFGENKLQARLATKKAKPDGQYYLKGDGVKSFIRTLNVRDLPGVGYATSNKLQQMNIKTCADLEGISLYELQKEFGKKNGQQLYDMCRGIDQTKLNLEHVRKSVSAEVNYGIRFENSEAAHDFLKKLSIEISDRLKKINSKGRCITLKLMSRAKEAPNEPLKFMGHGLCDVFNKSKNLIAPTDDPVIITREVLSLWNQLHQSPEDARGIGIQITKLESSKNKLSGSTLLKFIQQRKLPKKNIDESEYFINDNVNDEINKIEPAKSSAQNCNHASTSTNVNNKNANEIVNLENQSVRQEGQTNFTNVKSYEQEDDFLNNKLEDKSDNELIDEKSNKLIIHHQSKLSSQLKQTTQTEYFRQIKPSSSDKRGKVNMPKIEEIDMQVLIELPEDIRNEILNEYKEKKSNETEDNNSTNKRPKNNINGEASSSNGLEKRLSFSQVDPDFLAALPPEMRNEVKSYCDAQKKEKTNQVEEKRTNNIANKGWDMFKNEKKIQKTTKLKSGRLKIAKTNGKKETKNNTSKSNNKTTKETETISNRAKNQNSEKNLPSQTNNNDSSVNDSVHFDNLNGDAEHSEILSSLVNCLLDLPIQRVKQQMREWIKNTSDVNDVDFLSLTTYLGTLPRKHRLEDLFILMKCLYRIITDTGSCVWHETYRKMLTHIQARMRMEYGSNLMIPMEFNCEKCKVN